MSYLILAGFYARLKKHILQAKPRLRYYVCIYCIMCVLYVICGFGKIATDVGR